MKTLCVILLLCGVGLLAAEDDSILHERVAAQKIWMKIAATPGSDVNDELRQGTLSPSSLQMLRHIVECEIVSHRNKRGLPQDVQPGDKFYRSEGQTIRFIEHWGDAIVIQFDDGGALGIKPTDFKAHVPTPQEQVNALHEKSKQSTKEPCRCLLGERCTCGPTCNCEADHLKKLGYADLQMGWFAEAGKPGTPENKAYLAGKTSVSPPPRREPPYGGFGFGPGFGVTPAYTGGVKCEP